MYTNAVTEEAKGSLILKFTGVPRAPAAEVTCFVVPLINFPMAGLSSLSTFMFRVRLWLAGTGHTLEPRGTKGIGAARDDPDEHVVEDSTAKY